MSQAAPQLALDHCASVIHDLRAGAARWERLGFTLAPESRQRGAVPGREGMHPWATANRCAILGRTYLELVGIVDASAYNPWARFIAKNEGLHIFAARCDDADRAYDALSARTAALSPPVPRERILDVDGEPRTMRFRNIFSRDDKWPEARYLVIEHQTPEYLWQPRYQHHDNGACDLVAVTFVADDPSALVSRMEALGADVDSQREGFAARLPRHGVVYGMRSAAFADTYGHTAHSGMHALTVSFHDLGRTLALLEERGVATHTSPRGHWIAPVDANGFVMHLVQS